MTIAASALTIVPAGAGSGKTHYLQTELARRIKEEGLAPESIVAVTFTEAAAAELRGRIRAALVSSNMLDQATQLDQAYISTIHSFGLRLIGEFAFDGALSPTPRLLNDDEQGMLVSRAMSHSDGATLMMENLDRYGYRYNFMSETTPEDSFRKGLLSFIATLRGIGKTGASDKLIVPVEQKIRDLYGSTRIAEHLKDALLSAITALLRVFPADLSPGYSSVKSASEQLRNDFYRMRRASNGKALDTDWKLWQELRAMRISNKRTKLPPDYDDLAEQVMSAAHALPLHPGPLQDALNHARALLLAATESLNRYGDEKQQRGLVDFTDMLSQAHGLLCSNQQVADAFRQRVGCLVVDEFQDTNPLQFSLLWSLTRQGVPTIIVGDLKQAIMGFQGADARLMQELVNRHPEATKPQTGNYRSSKALMHWINLVGAGLFGDGYTSLSAEAPYTSTMPSPLEVLEAREGLNESVWASHTVSRLINLLDEQPQIYDRHQKQHRPLRGGDIAIICPTNKRLQAYAAALRGAGIRCRLEQEGWYESRIIQLVCYALQYLADTEDRYAALYLSVTELGSHTLQSALDQLVAGGKLTDPVLTAIEQVVSGRQDRFLDETLEALLAELDLYGVISLWPDGSQARANLLRLQQECREFRTANREALASGGYYGMEIKTFLAWLKGRAERDNSQPEAAVVDEDAVQLATWHSSKGREWPIVAVCGLERDTTPRLPTTRVAYQDFSDLANLLETSRVEIFPDFAAPESCEKFRDALLDETRDGATRLLYVALTRSREKLILEWPGNIAAKDTATGNSYWEILTGMANLELSGNTMLVSGTSVDCRITVVTKEPQELQQAEEAIQLQSYGRRAIIPRDLPTGLTPEHCTPSAFHGELVPQLSCATEQYAKPLLVLQGSDAAERGTLLHRCFELLLARPELADELPVLVGEPLTAAESCLIADTVSAFNQHLKQQLAPVSLRSEEPFIVANQEGTVITGTIDLLVETAEGYWIIDHKSDQITEEEIADRAAHYCPQLFAYAEAVAALNPGMRLPGIMMNWISLGMATTITGAANAL